MQQLAGESARTRCYGRVLELKKWGGGWIQPMQEINHPSISWNRGHIYLNLADVRQGCHIQPGDVVAFYLYADKKGLGAEDCFPVRVPTAAACPPPQLQAAMAALAMTTAAPAYKVPSPQAPPMMLPPGLDAPVCPQAAGKKDTTKPQAPPGFTPMQDNLKVNFALLIDSDDEDELVEVAMQPSGGAADRHDGVQSVCSRASVKSSLGDASTAAGFSDDGITSSAGSDRATSNPTTPVPSATRETAFMKGLEKTTAGAFSDDEGDEPAREPTPGSSPASSPKLREITVPKLYMI